MRAAILEAPKKFVIHDIPAPTPGDDEILVRTKVCGICTSELEQWSRRLENLEYPRYIGHEPAGIVEAVGRNVRTLKAGDHVSVWSEGKGYAEQFIAKEAHAYKLKPDTPFEQALGEPIACSVNGVRKLDPQLNDSVCIVGCGFMGLIMLQVFRSRGVGNLIAVDTREDSLSLAKKLGATHLLHPGRDDIRAIIRDITGGRGVDIGVEAAGNQQTLDLTSDIVRMEGKIEIFGFHQGEPRKVPMGYWNWMAFQIVNGHTRSSQIYIEGMKIGLTLLETGKLHMEDLVTNRYSLDKINSGFADAVVKPKGFVKGIVVMT